MLATATLIAVFTSRVSGSPAHAFSVMIESPATTTSTWGPHLLSRIGQITVAACALGTFLLMLADGGAYVGNRWFWFWVCAPDTIAGMLGLMLYLLLEWQPLWDRKPRLQQDKPPRGGWAGVFLAGAMAFVVHLAGLSSVHV